MGISKSLSDKNELKIILTSSKIIAIIIIIIAIIVIIIIIIIIIIDYYLLNITSLSATERRLLGLLYPDT